MAKVNIILDKRKTDKLGRCPIKLRIVAGNTNTTVSTGVFIPKEYFIGEPERAISRSYANAKQANSDIREMYYSFVNAIIELDKKGNTKAYTAADIRDLVNKNKEYQSERTFSSTIEEYRDSRRTYNTKRTYNYTINLLGQFTNKRTLFFEDVNYRFLVEFELWMEQRGMSGGGREIILHNIRAVYNYAINNDYISLSLYPFRKFKIKSYEKEKVYMQETKFRQLIALDFSNSRRYTLKLVRDFFLISFYLCGANPIDIFHMEKPKNNIISFNRKKIDYRIAPKVHITIQPELQKLIDKYKGEQYLFNFIEKHTSYHTFYSNLERYVLEFAKLIDEPDFTLYWARYSWATYASKIDIPDFTISKALGHSDATMAQRKYISFDWSKVDKANRRVIDYAVYGKE